MLLRLGERSSGPLMKVYGLKCKNPRCSNVFIIGRENQPRSEWVQPFGRQAQQCNVCHLNAMYHYEDVGLLEIREDKPKSV